MIIIITKKINGIGGVVEAEKPIHCHFEAYKGSFNKPGDVPEDNLFNRHLTIYLLDKYFRKDNKYTCRHIAAPIGELMGTNDNGEIVPIGMYTEHVYGDEISSFCNEHLDWKVVSEQFAAFGFTKLDYDYCSGFSGEEDSVDHNHIKQDTFFPEDKQKTFARPPTMSWLQDRYSTARWVRIDFGNDSFPFDKNIFLETFAANKDNLRAQLTAKEFYFLSQYYRLMKGEPVEDKTLFEESIQTIRQECLGEVYKDQVEILKRKIICLQLSQVSDFKAISYNTSTELPEFKDYMVKFTKALERYKDATLESLRKLDDTDVYLEQDKKEEADKHFAELVEGMRTKLQATKVSYPFFFKPQAEKPSNPKIPTMNKIESSP